MVGTWDGSSFFSLWLDIELDGDWGMLTKRLVLHCDDNGS